MRRIWSLWVNYRRCPSLALRVLEFQAGGPDVWHDSHKKKKSNRGYFYLPVHICALFWRARLKDGIGLHLRCGCEEFPTVGRPLIQFLMSEPPSTAQWLIRNVSGITPSAGRGRGRKYLQSSPEGNSLGVDLRKVASSAFVPVQSGSTQKPDPLMSSHVEKSSMISSQKCRHWSGVQIGLACMLTGGLPWGLRAPFFILFAIAAGNKCLAFMSPKH